MNEVGGFIKTLATRILHPLARQKPIIRRSVVRPTERRALSQVTIRLSFVPTIDPE
jgi:hypothetical protein